MTQLAPTIPPNNLRFGYPYNKRCEELIKLSEVLAKAHHRVWFKEQNMDLPIVRVPIDLPKYRLANGRTASLQAEYLAKNISVRDDIFSGDAELWDAQTAQHELLLLVVKKQDLRKTFEDPANKQIEPILLDEHGFVVNGNRRLCCWRDLYYQDSSRYGHFAYIDVAVLPHCDEKDIDRIEAWLQIQKDIKADYTWDARANMLLDKQKRDGFSNKELAELYGMKESEVTELIDMRKYADTYLRSRSKADRWSQVSEHEFAFQKIVALRQRISDVGNQDLFMEAAFTLIDNPIGAGGRLYDQIPAVLESLDEVKEKLAEAFPVEPQAVAPDIDDLFGGNEITESNAIALPLSLEIRKPENVEEARRIIVDVIAVQRELKKKF